MLEIEPKREGLRRATFHSIKCNSYVAGWKLRVNNDVGLAYPRIAGLRNQRSRISPDMNVCN
jgi:hypothetical protein